MSRRNLKPNNMGIQVKYEKAGTPTKNGTSNVSGRRRTTIVPVKQPTIKKK